MNIPLPIYPLSYGRTSWLLPSFGSYEYNYYKPSGAGLCVDGNFQCIGVNTKECGFAISHGKSIFSFVRKCPTVPHSLFLLVENLFFFFPPDLPHICTKGHIGLFANSTPGRVWPCCNVTKARSRFHTESGTRRPNLYAASYTDLLSNLSINPLFPLALHFPVWANRALSTSHLLEFAHNEFRPGQT